MGRDHTGCPVCDEKPKGTDSRRSWLIDMGLLVGLLAVAVIVVAR